MSLVMRCHNLDIILHERLIETETVVIGLGTYGLLGLSIDTLTLHHSTLKSRIEQNSPLDGFFELT